MKNSLSRADDSEEKVYKNVTVAGLAFYETILAAGVGEGVIRTNQSPKAREVA